jgi:hypothetical protein
MPEPLKLETFPFDSEELELNIQPFLGVGEPIVFEDTGKQNGVSREPYTNLGQWSIQDLRLRREFRPTIHPDKQTAADFLQLAGEAPARLLPLEGLSTACHDRDRVVGDFLNRA